jgi:acetyl esterase/lipase
MKSSILLVLVCGILSAAQVRAVESANSILLWPGLAPGETNTVSTEHDTSKPGERLTGGKPVIRLGDVNQPMITIYRPPAEKNTGAAIMVCPGGAYHILAYDLEGTETCAWLNSLGVTVALLKYRVPRKDEAPLQDAQRALGIVRHHAGEWGIDPHRIGVLGFSAGGNLTARLSANCATRIYPKVDDADAVSCRPDFQLLIYPAYLGMTNAHDTLVPEVAVTSNTPPTFIVMTMDDPLHVNGALAYALAAKQAHVPAELHIYPTGGHGYGMRRTKEPVTGWPDLAAAWLDYRGWLKHE